MGCPFRAAQVGLTDALPNPLPRANRGIPVKTSKLLLAAVAGVLAFIGAAGAEAADKTVVVAYQTDALPSSVAIADGEFDKATGYKIDFRRFNSGAEIFAAIASGDVQVGYVGSSPFAAATSRGLDVKAFYLASISGVDEALVVRNGSGINSLADLKGKKLAAAPVSTERKEPRPSPLGSRPAPSPKTILTS